MIPHSAGTKWSSRSFTCLPLLYVSVIAPRASSNRRYVYNVQVRGAIDLEGIWRLLQQQKISAWSYARFLVSHRRGVDGPSRSRPSLRAYGATSPQSIVSARRKLSPAWKTQRSRFRSWHVPIARYRFRLLRAFSSCRLGWFVASPVLRSASAVLRREPGRWQLSFLQISGRANFSSKRGSMMSWQIPLLLSETCGRDRQRLDGDNCHALAGNVFCCFGCDCDVSDFQTVESRTRQVCVESPTATAARSSTDRRQLLKQLAKVLLSSCGPSRNA